MIALAEGPDRRKTPNEIALTILLAALTLIFLVVTATLLPFSQFAVSQSGAGSSLDRGADRVSGCELCLTLLFSLRKSGFPPKTSRIRPWHGYEVWGQESNQQRHYVRILTAGLRRKLERDPSKPEFFHTEVGVGYRFFN